MPVARAGPWDGMVQSAGARAEYLASAMVKSRRRQSSNLAPIYYYRRALALEPLNLLALGALAALAVWLVVRRRRVPWTFFCAAWFGVALLPESNVAPLAQLRADRFLYLPLLGAAIWFAIGLERLPRLVAAPVWAAPLPGRLAGAALVIACALATHASAAVWRSDVSAWTRVAERHPWSATAFLLLGHAHRDAS